MAIADETTPAQVRGKAMELLARREYSRRDLQQQLQRRGYADDMVHSCLDELADEGLQSEQRFAESYAHVRVQRGYGPRHIRAQLREQGIDDALIARALDELGVDWQEQLAQAHAKRFGDTGPGDYGEQAKRMRFLARRGFSEADIRRFFRDWSG